jgi:hypothetical protein
MTGTNKLFFFLLEMQQQQRFQNFRPEIRNERKNNQAALAWNPGYTAFLGGRQLELNAR